MNSGRVSIKLVSKSKVCEWLERCECFVNDIVKRLVNDIVNHHAAH